MKNNQVLKLAIASLLCATAVVGSLFSFPVFGSKCAPIQHVVNLICAFLLGPTYGVGVAFCASLIRNIFGLGTFLAFPGSIFGALLCGLVYKKFKKILPTLLAEVFGTAVLGGLCAYPVAILLTNQDSAKITFYTYIIPFLISTAAGAFISALIIYPLNRTGILAKINSRINMKDKK